jgi:hypothetical protein
MLFIVVEAYPVVEKDRSAALSTRLTVSAARAARSCDS